MEIIHIHHYFYVCNDIQIGGVVYTYGVQPMHGCFVKFQLFMIICRIVQIFIRAHLPILAANNKFLHKIQYSPVYAPIRELE